MTFMKYVFALLIVFIFSGVYCGGSETITPEKKRPENVPEKAFFIKGDSFESSHYILTEKNGNRTVVRQWTERGTLLSNSVTENGRTRDQFFSEKTGMPLEPYVMELIPPKIKVKMEAVSRPPTSPPSGVPVEAIYNRKLWTHGKTVNAKREGRWMLWHREGANAGFVTYKNGVPHGKFKLLSKSGKILLQGTKEQGKTLNLRKMMKDQRKSNSEDLVP